MDLWNFKTIPISSAQQTKSKFCLPRGRKNDVWSFIWGTQNYSSRKFYALAFQSMQVPSSFTWLWKSKCTHESNFLAGYSLLIGSTAGICSDGAISILIQAIVVLCATLVQRKTFCIFSLTALLRPPAGSLYTYIGQMILIYMQSFLLAGRIVHMVFSRRFSQLLPGNFGSYGMTKSLTMAMLAEDFAFLVSKSKFTFSS